MGHPHGVLTLRREDGRVVCERVRVADTWLRRMRGLLFRRRIASDEGCVLRPGFSIHTMFMQFPIDVVFLDQDLVVLKISAAVSPFRTAGCRGAREVVELKAGECERRGLAVGDRVAWASSQASQASRPGADEAAPTDKQSPRTVVIASRDRRFVRLLRFLLESRGVDCVRDMSQDSLLATLDHLAGPAAIVLDAEPGTADALALANAVRARRPEIPVLLAAEAKSAGHAPVGTVIHDKWNGTDALAEAAAAASEGSSGATPPGVMHAHP